LEKVRVHCICEFQARAAGEEATKEEEEREEESEEESHEHRD
jgi:hypothetical protein